MLHSKQLEIIEENTRLDSKKIKSHMITFFEHVLKWKYQPERYEVSWIRSIIDNSIIVRDLIYKEYPNKRNSNVFNKASETIRDAYEQGKINAAGITGKSIIKNDVFIWNSFNTLESISNLDYVKIWLIKNAITDEMINGVNKNTRV